MKDPKERQSDQCLSCFGRLDRVFPKGEDGLRHTPQDCLACPEKTKCLRAAVQGKGGIAVKEEKLDREYASGQIGFLERWSRKKGFQQSNPHKGGILNWLRTFTR